MFWENAKPTIVDLYLNTNWSLDKIGNVIGVWGTTISAKLSEWEIPKRERPNKKYELDAHYFDEIDTEHKAYWYGFLFADGHINNNLVMLTLQKRDEDVIRSFAEDIQTNIPIKPNRDGNPSINIACKIMTKALLSKGFNHRKSYEADIEKIASFVPPKLLNHFIRGMFDGDGCVGIYEYDYASKPQCHFGYTGLINVCEYIANILDIHTKIQQESEHAFTVKTRDPSLISKITDYLYKDATIYMDRKHEKLMKIKLITFNDYNGGIPLG